jgi:hypothetical protein
MTTQVYSNNNSSLQKEYIRKYISINNNEKLLQFLLIEFEEWYFDSSRILNKNLDFIIYMMKHQEVVSLVRNALIYLKRNNLLANDLQQYASITEEHTNKSSLIRFCIETIPNFKSYFIICLYSLV